MGQAIPYPQESTRAKLSTLRGITYENVSVAVKRNDSKEERTEGREEK